jgi:hypothetical protein
VTIEIIRNPSALGPDALADTIGVAMPARPAHHNCSFILMCEECVAARDEFYRISERLDLP